MKVEAKENLDYYYNPKNDEDFYKIALDVFGSGIRDNSKKEIIQIGKDYHDGIIEDYLNL